MNLFLFITMIFMNFLFGYLYTKFMNSFLGNDSNRNVTPDEYITIIVSKSIAWAYMIMLPLLFIHGFEMNLLTFYIFIANIILCIVSTDNLNHGNFNLIVKEILNIIQILVTFLILKE